MVVVAAGTKAMAAAMVVVAATMDVGRMVANILLLVQVVALFGGQGDEKSPAA